MSGAPTAFLALAQPAPVQAQAVELAQAQAAE
jgi:hypothetical protein